MVLDDDEYDVELIEEDEPEPEVPPRRRWSLTDAQMDTMTQAQRDEYLAAVLEATRLKQEAIALQIEEIKMLHERQNRVSAKNMEMMETLIAGRHQAASAPAPQSKEFDAYEFLDNIADAARMRKLSIFPKNKLPWE